MPNEILQRFLDHGLLDVGEDTERFTHVGQAADDLAEGLRLDKRALLRASSVLVADRLVDGEPIAKRCDEAIKKHWPTYRSRFPTAPNELLRAALLQAIANVTSSSDAPSAALVYYTASSLFPYVTAAKHADIFKDLLLGLGQATETAAAAHWGDQGHQGAPQLAYGDAALPIAGLNVKSLGEAMRDSAGPTPGATGHNPEWPGANTATWLEHFGKASAEAISTAVLAALKDLVPAVITQTRSDNAKVVAALRGPAGDPSDRLRSRLLYWSATLFSSSRATSYRKLPPTVAAYWTAYDLWRLVPQFHPQSVEFFLRETLRQSIGDEAATEEVTLERFCTEASVSSPILVSPPDLDATGLTLLSVVQATAGGSLPAADAAQRLGVSDETAISREDLAVWLFRDLQAARLAGMK